MTKRTFADKVLQLDPSLPDFFLGRLARLVARQAAATDLTERTVLGLATLSTFLDCLELGLAEQADAIAEHIRDELDLDEYPAA
jgi:hypothetical protein